MKKALFTKLLLILVIGGMFAQAGQIDKTFNSISGAGFDKNVAATAIQTDGKILVAGAFKSYDYNAKNAITRLNVDGTLDTSFVIGTGANFEITAMLLQSDGKILILGGFTSYNGTARNRIARLNEDGTLDSTFNSGTGYNFYSSLAIQTDGKILIGGSFSSYNDIAVKNILRLNSDGSLDTSFNQGTGANGTVAAVVAKSDGTILIAGNFNTYNETSRIRIAQLNANGTLDTSFNPGNGANNTINCMVVQGNNKILIGGSFSTYNFGSRNRIARLNADGTLDNSFDPGSGIDNSVKSIVIQADGKIIIGGQFSQYAAISRNNIARINSDGTFDTTFNPGIGTNQRVSCVTLKLDGKILISGDFTTYDAIGISRLAQLNTDGTLDTGFFNPKGIGAGSNNPIYAMALQVDGKILIATENISTYNGVSFNRLARLNADGTLDTTFNSGSGPSSTVYDIAIQSDGKIILVGKFALYNGISRNGIVRINADGTLDSSFNVGTGVNSIIYSVKIQTDGKILIVGAFTSYKGTSRNRIARINTEGTVDATFDPGTGANDEIFSVAVQSDGKILIAGAFKSYDGNAKTEFCRLNANGTFDSSFNMGGSGVGYNVRLIKIGLDEKIYIAGQFTSYNGIASNSMARLNTDGTLDTTFVPQAMYNPNRGTNSTGWPKDMTLQSDGKIIIVGAIYTYGGTVILNIARLENNGALDTSFVGTTGEFDLNSSSYASNIILQPDGKILIAGMFKLNNNLPVGFITRMLSDNIPLSTVQLDKETLIIYPNPATATVYFSKTLTEIAVYDILGRKINIPYTFNSADISALKKGIYILKGVDNNRKRITQKIIKQ